MLGPISITTAASTASTLLQADYQKTGTVSVQNTAVTSGAGGLVYELDWSLDAPSSQTNWFSSGSSNQSSHSLFAFTFPVRSLRVNVTSGTSNMSVVTTVIQSQI